MVARNVALRIRAHGHAEEVQVHPRCVEKDGVFVQRQVGPRARHHRELVFEDWVVMVRRALAHRAVDHQSDVARREIADVAAVECLRRVERAIEKAEVHLIERKRAQEGHDELASAHIERLVGRHIDERVLQDGRWCEVDLKTRAKPREELRTQADACALKPEGVVDDASGDSLARILEARDVAGLKEAGDVEPAVVIEEGARRGNSGETGRLRCRRFGQDWWLGRYGRFGGYRRFGRYRLFRPVPVLRLSLARASWEPQEEGARPSRSAEGLGAAVRWLRRHESRRALAAPAMR